MKKSAIPVAMAVAAALAALTVTGCGAAASAGSSSVAASPAASSAPPPAAATSPTVQPTSGSAGALTGEAASAATGDVPDNQAFLTLTDASGGFSMKYPEGWAQRHKGGALTIQDKNNIVRVTVTHGPVPTVASVRQDMAALLQQTPSLRPGTPAAVTVAGHPAVKVTYTTESAPNPVTGKTVTLSVDRYYFSHGGKVAVLDLGTPQGVDNVDAYRLMSESFTWK